MICNSCEGDMDIAEVNCYNCNKPLHKDCAYQCVKCGEFLCDSCALKQNFKCNDCLKVEQVKMEFISATMFESYEKCPYSFKHEHIMKAFTEEERMNKYSAVGTILHALFDKYSNIRPLDNEAKLLMIQSFELEFDKLNPDLFESSDDILNYKSIGMLEINNWIKEEAERPLPLYTEKQHFFNLDGIDMPIRATIDRINGAGSDSSEWEVEDYKTGKVYSSDMLRNNFQLPIYALAIREVYGALPKSLRLRFPQHSDSSGAIKERIFERITDDIYVCNVPRGGTYSFSLTERLSKMQDICNKIKHGEFALNTKNGVFCERFCILGKSKKCSGIETRWDIANKRGY